MDKSRLKKKKIAQRNPAGGVESHVLMPEKLHKAHILEVFFPKEDVEFPAYVMFSLP